MELTVKDLLICCKDAIENGNGEKVILIPNNANADEYHPLLFGIEDDPNVLKTYQSTSFNTEHNLKDVVLLG